MKDTPLQIVGGGLAGLALAIALSKRGCPVIVHEAFDYPRHRVCGEFVAGLDGKTIHELGLQSIMNKSVMNQTTAWFHRRNPILNARLPQPAPSLSRYYLDAKLAELFCRNGGELRTGKRVNLSALQKNSAEGWIIASGRKPNTRSPLVGLKCHLRNLPISADLEMHLGKGGYAGITRVENHTLNLCGLFHRLPASGKIDRDLMLHYLQQHQLHLLAEKFDAATWVEGSFCAVAALEYVPGNDSGNGLLYLGDAAAMIPPFTGHGMALAIESANIALEPLLAYASGKSHWQNTRRTIDQESKLRFAKRRRWARCINYFLLHPPGPALLQMLAVSRLLPFDFMLRRLHH